MRLLLIDVHFTGSEFGDSKSRVYVLGPDDGHSRLVDIARQLSSAVAMQRLSLDHLTVSYVDSVVQGKFVYFYLPNALAAFDRLAAWHGTVARMSVLAGRLSLSHARPSAAE